ncbi:hypothetical protein SAMN05216188_12183 [Lentzea xinjiangensis]|uniref:Lipoprotein n=1 Tax=Lentzea xinjiangensis TaxID=402600 RepID=A0A1H9UG53_9PSEU|nr:hypothetical protein [Lentzea xinjiangensis]SES08154.1 hypothetical protein SAMN05216188_12183 [Lentzea xinjiangensis]
MPEHRDFKPSGAVAAGWRTPARKRWSLAVVLSLLVTGCTAGPFGLTSSGTSGVVTAQVAAPSEKTTVLDAEPGAGSAIAVSSALFRSSPVVVVAAESDREALAGAGALAERLGVPVLQLPASTLAEPGTAAVRDEVGRLSPQVVLTVGADARREVEAWAGKAKVVGIDAPEGGATTTELPAGLPAVEPAGPVDVTVLSDKGRDDAAAVATARAAGARIVSLRGVDPRSDAAATDALRSQPSAALLALGKDFGPPDRLRKRVDAVGRGGSLPGGGQVLFPGRMLVCLYGHPDGPALGALGEQDLEGSIARVKGLAAEYDPLSDVPVVPTLEIIATVAQSSPGPDGDYSSETDVESLRPWVERAGQEGVYVILDLQPGRARLLDQAKRYAPLLELSHVGLAVDPEWKLGPGQVPLQQIGGVDAAEINEVSAWLADLTAAKQLPQKLLVAHQFQLSMIRDEQALDTTRDEVQLLIHMDGQGTTGQKVSTWESVVGARPGNLPMGWKNFYDEDKPMLTPQQTMSYEPKPSMVSYQ